MAPPKQDKPGAKAGPRVGLSGEEAEFEDFLLLNPEGRLRLRQKYRKHICHQKFDFDWKAVPYNRIALINLLAARIGPACRYLEIGCDADQLFAAVPLADKTGVDPVQGGNCRMTSDEFFAGNSREFDLVFVDGLHTYEQLHRDVVNALACLAPGGYIAIHDLVPLDWLEEHVPRLNGAWTGDVWKVGVEIARTPGIDFRLVLIDHGVGLIRRGAATPPMLADLSDTLGPARFKEFHKTFPDLPTADWDALQAWLEETP